MQTKLICSDIDGTLLNKDRELSDKTVTVINQLNTIPFILISSRMPQGMEHLQKRLGLLGEPLICYNGGLILQGDKVISSTEINIDVMVGLINFCQNTSLHTSLYHGREWYVTSMDYWAKREENNTKVSPELQDFDDTIASWRKEDKGAHKIMCMGDAEEIDRLQTYIKMNYSDEIVGYRSKDTYLEISPKLTNKKTALELLLDTAYSGISLAEVMAFGDNYNDIEMLQSVGCGVAVDNANTEAKKAAKYITKTNKQDGVALFLESRLLLTNELQSA